jgi:hypothetical protein
MRLFATALPPRMKFAASPEATSESSTIATTLAKAGTTANSAPAHAHYACPRGIAASHQADAGKSARQVHLTIPLPKRSILGYYNIRKLLGGLHDPFTLDAAGLGAHVPQPRSQRRPRHAPPLAHWTPHDIELRYLRQRTVPSASLYRYENARLNGFSLRRLRWCSSARNTAASVDMVCIIAIRSSRERDP